MNIVPRDHWFNIDQYFDGIFAHPQLKGRDGYFEPRVDIIEKEDCYLFVAELPGVDKHDIKLEVTARLVVIDVNTPEKKAHKRLDLPTTVNPNTTKSTYKNGIFDITLEKSML